jgi:hypothetical protein
MYGSFLPAGYSFKDLSIPITVYVYNGNSILHKIKLSRLKQNSCMIIVHIKDQTFSLSFVEVIFKAKVYIMWGYNSYNNLLSYVKNIKNIQLFRRKRKLFLFQQTFYSVDERLLYKFLL